MFVGYRNQIPRWRMFGLGMNPLGESYIEKVLGIQSANLIGYWPLNETAGAIADNIQGVAARDGAYTGVTLNSITGPDGVNGAPLFDGANDFVDIYSASLDAAYAAPAAGTVAIWARQFNVGVWTDGMTRRAMTIAIDATNQQILFKPAAINQLNYLYAGGGTVENLSQTPISDTGWFHVGVTWDVGVDEMKAYFNGVQEGATQNGIGTLVGNLGVGTVLIGAATQVPATVWNGYLAHGLISTIAYTPAEMLELATV